MSELSASDVHGVRTITLNRPESKNGLTIEINLEFGRLIREAPADVRVIVITGAGGAFSSGLDLKHAMKGGMPTADGRAREAFHGLIRALVDSDRPTIAAVDGPAVGFGCDLALACDLRICSDRAVFGEIFVKRALMPDGGGTFHLPRIVGLGRALELMFLGDLVTADDALRIGLANQVVAAAEHAARTAEIAARIAEGPPLAYRLTKRAVYAGLDGDLAAALDREAEGQMQLLRSADFAESVMAFMQKRPPKFTGK